MVVMQQRPADLSPNGPTGNRGDMVTNLTLKLASDRGPYRAYFITWQRKRHLNHTHAVQGTQACNMWKVSVARPWKSRCCHDHRQNGLLSAIQHSILAEPTFVTNSSLRIVFQPTEISPRVNSQQQHHTTVRRVSNSSPYKLHDPAHFATCSSTRNTIAPWR